MIIEIIPGDILTREDLAGEKAGTPKRILAWTNHQWINKRGFLHEIGSRYNQELCQLLKTGKTVPLWHVFSVPCDIEGMDTIVHPIAVNRRIDSQNQDWSELWPSLRDALSYLYVHRNLGQEEETEGDENVIDGPLLERIRGIVPSPGIDVAHQVREMVIAHIRATREPVRSVLIGGADGQKNAADLTKTISAMEDSLLPIILFLGTEAQKVAVRNVIPLFPALQARKKLVDAVAA